MELVVVSLDMELSLELEYKQELAVVSTDTERSPEWVVVNQAT